MDGLVAIFCEIVQYGLDPGLPRKNEDTFGSAPLDALAALSNVSKDDSSRILSLARIMIEKSIHNPLSGITFAPTSTIGRLAFRAHIPGLQVPLYTVLRTQEKWPMEWIPISEFHHELRPIAHNRDLDLGNIDRLPLQMSSILLKDNRFPLEKILCYNPSPFVLSQILDENDGFEIEVLEALCYLLIQSHLGLIEHQELLSGLHNRLIEGFAICSRRCQLLLALELPNPTPSLQLLDIIFHLQREGSFMLAFSVLRMRSRE